jgi:xanthine dehydrogenase small subunit
MSEINLVLNGKPTMATNCEPHTTLLNWLRDSGLTGCKEGCAEGECGACAVLLTKSNGTGSRLTSVNACLVLMAGLGGQEIMTAEGLGSPNQLHPVQAAMVTTGGSQCGYCTPGFISSMADEYYRPNRTAFDLEALSGNLCRCTGYRSIKDAAFGLGLPDSSDALFLRQNQPAPEAQVTVLESESAVFYRPENLEEALVLLEKNPSAKLVAGGTDWGVEVNLRFARAGVQIAIDHLPELRQITWQSDFVELGAALTLSELEHQIGDSIPLLHQWFPMFASRLIRNSATLGGNIGTASPIGDSPPVLLALGASVVLVSKSGERIIPLKTYFTGYRKTLRQHGEIIKAIRIPLPLAPISKFYKISKRKMDDISSVSVGIALTLENHTVQDIKIGLGGVAATPLRALETENFLIGQIWNLENVTAAAQLMALAGTPLDDHRASAAYRKAMLEQLLLKFFAEVNV